MPVYAGKAVHITAKKISEVQSLKEIGSQLKDIREEKGYSLIDVQRATKIRAEFIDALEKGDLDALPGRVYGIGFARTYGKFLGLDENEIVAVYKTYYNETEAKKMPKKWRLLRITKPKTLFATVVSKKLKELRSILTVSPSKREELILVLSSAGWC